MSVNIRPAFPPQIMLDQFSRPVAPIPGMSMLDYFALELLKIRYEDYKKAELHTALQIFKYAIQDAENFLNLLQKHQAEANIENIQILNK